MNIIKRNQDNLMLIAQEINLKNQIINQKIQILNHRNQTKKQKTDLILMMRKILAGAGKTMIDN